MTHKQSECTQFKCTLTWTVWPTIRSEHPTWWGPFPGGILIVLLCPHELPIVKTAKQFHLGINFKPEKQDSHPHYHTRAWHVMTLSNKFVESLSWHGFCCLLVISALVNSHIWVYKSYEYSSCELIVLVSVIITAHTVMVHINTIQRQLTQWFDNRKICKIGMKISDEIGSYYQ